MRHLRPALLASCLLALSACAPTTPLFIAQITTNEVVEQKALKNARMAAAVEEEGDLLTYSAMAIRDGTSAKAEALYMSRYNDQRDDTRALNLFYQVTNEFPGTHAAEHAQARILMIQKRAEAPVQKTARELLADWKPSQNLDLYQRDLDPDMTLLSRRAVLKDRVGEAEQLYALALIDDHVQPDIKARALYQMALMNLAPANPHADRQKAVGYLRRLLAEFPDAEQAEPAARHLDMALNPGVK